ncbi:hypothetical protein V8F20_008573 [Naviculisporaceae sp. PSN 640]
MECVEDFNRESSRNNSHSGQTPLPPSIPASHIPSFKYVCLLDENIDHDFVKIKEAWQAIKDGIFDILQSSSATLGYMTSISLFKLGPSIRRHNNPKTVFVSVLPKSPEREWPPVVRAMQAYLDTFGFGLRAHLEHNEMCHELFELLPISTAATGDVKLDYYPGKELEEDYYDGRFFKLLPYTKLRPHERYRRDQDFAPRVLDEYATKVCPGADIGAAKYITRFDGRKVSPMTGSLACWLDLTLHNGKKVTVGLTCYHILRPAILGYQLDCEEREYCPPGWDSRNLVKRSATTRTSAAAGFELGYGELLSIDANAYVEPRDRYKRFPPAKIEHPTRARHNAIWEESHRIFAQPDLGASLVNEIDEKLLSQMAFFDKRENILGSIILASALHNSTSINSSLDIGLILPDNPARIGPNTLPSFDSFVMKYPMELLPNWHPGPTIMRNSRFVPQDDPRQIYTPLPKRPHLSPVYKSGPSLAGSTIGLTSAFPSDIVFSQAKDDDEPDQMWRKLGPHTSSVGCGHSSRTREFVVASSSTQYDRIDNHPFAYAGDNGSLVWDKYGRVIGMLVGGIVPKDAESGIYIVTPIEEVFEGIKEVAQGRILDVKVRMETTPPEDQGAVNEAQDLDW